MRDEGYGRLHQAVEKTPVDPLVASERGICGESSVRQIQWVEKGGFHEAHGAPSGQLPGHPRGSAVGFGKKGLELIIQRKFDRRLGREPQHVCSIASVECLQQRLKCHFLLTVVYRQRRMFCKRRQETLDILAEIIDHLLNPDVALSLTVVKTGRCLW